MHKSQMIIVTGVAIALLPILGFPRVWEAFFQVLAGLAIIGISVWSTIDRKLSQKAKAQMRAYRKVAPVAPQAAGAGEAAQANEAGEAGAPGRRHTDFYPKTGQPGRRVTDLKPPFTSQEEDLI